MVDGWLVGRSLKDDRIKVKKFRYEYLLLTYTFTYFFIYLLKDAVRLQSLWMSWNLDKLRIL